MADEGVAFRVLGEPGAKGSRTERRGPGGVFQGSYEQNYKKVKPWMEAVEAAVGQWATVYGAMNPPYRVRIEFLIARPKKPTYAWPVKGDLDKFVRATLDAMQAGGLIEDDKHVVEIETSKAWVTGDSGANICVWSVDVDTGLAQRPL